MSFEYQVVAFDSERTWEEIEESLNIQGSDGWRMTGAFNEVEVKQVVVFLMREKKEQADLKVPLELCLHGITKRSCLVCS